MRRLIAATVLFSGMTVSQAQFPSRQLSFPVNPSQEALDRLNLQYMWRLKLPVESHRDGIASIQHMGKQVLVQLRSGPILAIESETGAIQWTAHVGQPYPVRPPLGFSDDLVFVVNGPSVVALERSNGTIRWDLDVGGIPSAAPSAGRLLFYVPLPGGRVSTFSLPETTTTLLAQDEKNRAKVARAVSKIREAIAPAAPVVNSMNDPRLNLMTGVGRKPTIPELKLRQGLNTAITSEHRYVQRNFTQAEMQQAKARPIFLSTRTPGFRVDYPVQPFPLGVMTTGSHNQMLALRLDRFHPISEFTGTSPQVTPPVISGSTAYVCLADGRVGAINLQTGFVMWRWLGHSVASGAPIVAGDSLFIPIGLHGLVRIDRFTGQEKWVNDSAHHYVSSNDKFVYTTDRIGRLQVLDRVQGRELSLIDVSDFLLPLANDRTDRLVLAANDGSLVCLRDQDLPAPLDIHPRQQLPLPGILKPEEKQPPSPPAAKPPETPAKET